MSMHVCRIHGCPRISDASLCPPHRAEYEKRRGSPKQRDYGANHQAERERLKRAGIQNFNCARCGRRFHQLEPFDLGHTDDRNGWSGPEHQRCNRQAAGKAAHGH